ncbi:SDR family NAD(P)-dependent oxidoreductase [uncultured Jatrophihabitans sp.]|uniref:SDR family NAD(P)-dependent oxidoreductase n=1 Tax=uncultured Jatrophihabitans sp. TaxID=1610747 RepID=UPI0035C9D2B5
MTELKNKVVVITGAGSGIGRALAQDFARSGAKLALSDVDATGLAQTVKQVRLIGAPVHHTSLDVTDRAAVLAYADEVVAEYGVVNVIVNNAGIAFTGDIEKMSFDQIERVMAVDFWGVVHGTKAFLPHLIASGDGHVVNISSLFGLLSMPSQSAYNAAKFAVRGFTESLREEMLIAGHPVQVTCVHPGGIKTAIARNAGVVDGEDQKSLAEFFDAKLAKMTPEDAAKVIRRAVIRNRPRVLVGWDAKALHLLVRVTGAGYERLVALAAGRMVPKTVPAAAAHAEADTGQTTAASRASA